MFGKMMNAGSVCFEALENAWVEHEKQGPVGF
jgi:hypothetical protein